MSRPADLRAPAESRELTGSAEPPDADAEWEHELADRLAHRLGAAPAVSFVHLLDALPGTDPTTVYTLLTRIATETPIRPDLLARARRAMADARRRAPHGPADPFDQLLPTPHPLDYEWRFTPSTRADLLAEITRLAPRTVLLLGCPTLALEILRRGAARRTVLVDDNPALPFLPNLVPRAAAPPGVYRQLRADLEAHPEATRGVTADLVVADAPFYDAVMRGFLRAAATGSRPGARLLLVLPPAGTRPSAVADAANAVAFAGYLGYAHQGTDSARVRYRRPLFEARAHQAARLHGVPEDWRSADLAGFDLTDPRPVLPVSGARSRRDQWHEVAVLGTRWRVRRSTSGARAQTGGMLLGPVVPGDILDSVSRRDIRRAAVMVCTDGNEVFDTSEPGALLAVLDAVSERTDPYQAAARSLGHPLNRVDQAQVRIVVAAALRCAR